MTVYKKSLIMSINQLHLRLEKIKEPKMEGRKREIALQRGCNWLMLWGSSEVAIIPYMHTVFLKTRIWPFVVLGNQLLTVDCSCGSKETPRALWEKLDP